MAKSRIGMALLISGLATCATLLAACGAAEPNTRITFPDAPTPEKPKGKVLFAVSAAREQVLADGTTRATGTFLGELYGPYVEVSRLGYEVVVSTVAAARPAIDPESLDDDYWDEPAEREEALRFLE